MSEVGTGSSRILVDAGEGKPGVLQARRCSEYCHEISENRSIKGACSRNAFHLACKMPGLDRCHGPAGLPPYFASSVALILLMLLACDRTAITA